MPLKTISDDALNDAVPVGLVVTRAWLRERGWQKASIDNLVRSERLLKCGHGVYRRPEAPLRWQAVICSLQRMNQDIHVGGLSALALYNLDHYLPASETVSVDLYSARPLPNWLDSLIDGITFVRHRPLRLNKLSKKQFKYEDNSDHEAALEEQALRLLHLPELSFLDLGLIVSSPERAFLEVLMDVPKTISFDHADELMQGFSNFSPHRLQSLLATSNDVKVNRLFLWLARRHSHGWLKHLDEQKIHLGSGKRALAPGGHLEKRYLITVPEHLYGME